MPPAVVLTDRLNVITALNLMSPLLNLLLLRRVPGKVDRQAATWLLPMAMLGMPVGLVILRELPTGPFRILAGGLSIVFGAMIHARRFDLPQTRLAFGLTGLLSGALQTSTTMSGPPVVMALLSGSRPATMIRRTLAVIFLGMALPTIVLLGVTRTYTGAGILQAAAAIPLVLLAGYLGDRVSRRVPRERFRTISLALVYATGVFGIVSAIRA